MDSGRAEKGTQMRPAYIREMDRITSRQDDESGAAMLVPARLLEKIDQNRDACSRAEFIELFVDNMVKRRRHAAAEKLLAELDSPRNSSGDFITRKEFEDFKESARRLAAERERQYRNERAAPVTSTAASVDEENADAYVQAMRQRIERVRRLLHEEDAAKAVTGPKRVAASAMPGSVNKVKREPVLVKKDRPAAQIAPAATAEKKSGSALWKGVRWTTMGVMVLIICMFGFLHFSPDYKLYLVKSESMTPTINVADMIVTGPVGGPLTGEIRQGAVVTYKHGKDLFTHRVVSVDGQKVVTKGDACEEVDPWGVTTADVVGIEFLRIPAVGHLTTFVQTKLGWFLVVIIPSLALVGLLVREIIKEMKKQIETKQEEAVAA